MFGLFKDKKPQEKRYSKQGKATIVIWTVTGENYRIPITGYAMDWGMNGIFSKNVREAFLDYKTSDRTFISINATKMIPICNIKTMELVDIDDNFEVEIQ